VNGATQALYRVHGANMHLTACGSLLLDLRERLSVFDAAFPCDGDPASADAARNDAARRALAREALILAWQAKSAGGSRGGASVEEFCQWACETWPGTVRSPCWRVLQRRPGRVPDEWERWASSLYLKARTHLWWRRWRRYGL
jgi:hypothetical protein